mmetsp:Transcript_103626/g.292462  ORF Transcript_103626/g.292462 Transcript_103626/m.292462 type:complete len:432 (-) Transcript_103626:88-1383(-)
MTSELDFDSVEQLLEDAARDPCDRDSVKTHKAHRAEAERKADRAKEPELAEDRKKRRVSRSRDRERDRDRDRERDRERRGEKEVLTEKERAEREVAKERERIERAQREEEEERQKAIDDATRGDRTVMVSSLAVKADERDIYEFFTSSGSLKVRDVQIIRDARTGRSKGVGYIEFYSQEFALKALTMNGQPIRGHNVSVQPSHAEKNRMAAATATGGSLDLASPAEPPMRLFVGGLVDGLASVTDEVLRKLFAPFGEIDLIEMHQGFAFIQFRRASDARNAMASMNNFPLADGDLKVGVAASDMQPSVGHAAGGRAQIPALGNGVSEDPGMPSPYVALHGMFSPAEVNLKTDPNFYSELEEEIEEECQKFGRAKSVHAGRQKNEHGTVWVRFGGIPSATNCRTALDKRWFGGRQIHARFVTESEFRAACRS